GGRLAIRAGCHAPDVGDRERALVHRLDEVRAVDHRPQVDVGSHGLEPQGVDESGTDGDERTRERSHVHDISRWRRTVTRAFGPCQGTIARERHPGALICPRPDLGPESRGPSVASLPAPAYRPSRCAWTSRASGASGGAASTSGRRRPSSPPPSICGCSRKDCGTVRASSASAGTRSCGRRCRSSGTSIGRQSGTDAGARARRGRRRRLLRRAARRRRPRRDARGAGDNLDALRRDGLTVRLADRTMHLSPVHAVREPADAPRPALVLVCVKSHDTPAAAAALRPVVSADTIVLSLQNGIENEEIIARELAIPPLMVACTRIGVALVAPATIEYSGRGTIVFGEVDGRESPRARQVAATLAAAGVPYELRSDILVPAWEKLAWNAGFNAVTTLTQATVAQVMAQPGSRGV